MHTGGALNTHTVDHLLFSLLFQPRLVPAWRRRWRRNRIMPIALQSQTTMRRFDKRKWQVRMERSLAALINEQRRRRDDKQIRTLLPRLEASTCRHRYGSLAQVDELDEREQSRCHYFFPTDRASSLKIESLLWDYSLVFSLSLILSFLFSRSLFLSC